MAVAVTSLGVLFNTTAGDKTVTATPAVNDFIVVVAGASGSNRNNAATTAVSDNNSDGQGAYSRVVLSNGTNPYDVGIFVRNAAVGSATSTVFTASQGSSTGGGLQVFKVTGMSKFGGVTGVNQNTANNGLTATTPSMVFGHALTVGNPVIAAIIDAENPAYTGAPTGYTEQNSSNYASPTISLETASKDSASAVTTVAWTAATAAAWEGCAIELDSSALSNTGTPASFNLPYRAPDDPNLIFTGKLYTPTAAKWGNGPWPAIVCTRCGGYTQGGAGESNDMLNYLSGDASGGLVGQGFLCLFADVRLVKSGGSGGLSGQTTTGLYPQPQNDLMLAMHYMRSHPLCNGFVGLIGGSGAGDLAAQVAILGNPHDTQPDAVVILSGQFDASDSDADVTTFFTTSVQNYYNSTDPVYLKANSAIGKVQPWLIPMYFSNGQNENMPYSVFTHFKAQLDTLNVLNYESHVNTADGGIHHSYGSFPENQNAITEFLLDASAETGGASAGAPTGKSISSGLLPSLSERMSKRGNIVGPQTYSAVMSSKSRAQYANLKAKVAKGQELDDDDTELWNVLSGLYG